MTVMRAWLLTGVALFLALPFVLPAPPPPSPEELAEQAKKRTAVAAQRAEDRAKIQETAHEIACWWYGGPAAGDRVWARGWSLSNGLLYEGWGEVIWVGEETLHGHEYVAHVRLDTGKVVAAAENRITFAGDDPRNAC